MKKSIVLFAACAVALGADARDFHRNAQQQSPIKPVKERAAAYVANKAAVTRGAAKATAAPFYTETFATGINGWTTASVTPAGSASWKWYPAGQLSTAPYHIAAINTTNGFMIYDSDSIGGGGTGNIVPEGTLTSPVINCSGKSTVALTFDEYYRRFQDSCFVEVATNAAFTGATRYAVAANNGLSSNDYVATNPFNVFINISSAAANQSTVYIRFHYYGPPGGGYSWQVDNINLSPLDPVNVALHNSFLFRDSTQFCPYGSSIGNIPSEFRDSISPVTKLDNLGSAAQNGFTVTAKVYKNNVLTSYNQSLTFPALPVGGTDSIAQFPYYYPPAGGVPTDNYFCAFAVNVAGNTNTTQLVDTVRFSITDSTWDQNTLPTVGSFYVHRPANDPPELSLYIGTRFDVQYASDSVTSVEVGLQSSTTAGSTIQVQIYSLTLPATMTTGWDTKFTTYTHTITAAEVTNGDCIIPIDHTFGAAMLTPGTWAAVVCPVNVPANNTVLILDSKPSPATPYSGYFGQEDTSHNTGSFEFGFQTQQTGITNIPLVRLHFGEYPAVHVNEVVSILKQEDAYPNPANNEINIPFTLTEDAPVNVMMTNVAGQVVNAKGLDMVKAKQRNVVKFPTTDLPAGVYFYTIDVNGKHVSNRFVVAH